MKRVCEIRELPDLAALRQWAACNGALVLYLGPNLEKRPVYGATSGHASRVTVGKEHDPYRSPLIWRSPLENLLDFSPRRCGS